MTLILTSKENMNRNFDTRQYTIEQKKDLCARAKAICKSWWVDVLDCSVSLSRQRVEMPFEEILQKIDDKCFFAVIQRIGWQENVLQIVFSTMYCNKPDYYLWIEIEPELIPEFTKDMKVIS